MSPFYLYLYFTLSDLSQIGDILGFRHLQLHASLRPFLAIPSWSSRSQALAQCAQDEKGQECCALNCISMDALGDVSLWPRGRYRQLSIPKVFVARSG